MTTIADASHEWSVPIDHASLAGHFPGRPIVPGVVLLAVVTEALLADAESARRIGAAPRLGTVKFLSACLPGESVGFAWRHETGRIAFEARRIGGVGAGSDAGALVVSGHYLATTP